MKIGRILLIADCLLAFGAAMSAQPTCSVRALRGVYHGDSTGYVPAQMADPNAAPGLVPFACVSQLKFPISESGAGTGLLLCNVAGQRQTIEVTVTGTTINEDCSGDIAFVQTVKETGVSIAAKARLFTTPAGEEIRWVAGGGGIWAAKLDRIPSMGVWW